MKRRTISDVIFSVGVLSWDKNTLIDYKNCCNRYAIDAAPEFGQSYNWPYDFDGIKTSTDGVYIFMYTKLGTKGLLIKNGELLREINRSYYYASTYDYPVEFYTNSAGRTFLLHCPFSYNKIDFEDVETGEIIGNKVDRIPSDFFHSRFEVSPNGKFLLSKGWIWHPMNAISLSQFKSEVRKNMI